MLMQSFIQLVGEFFKYSTIMCLISETISGLIISLNKAFFITQRELEIKNQKLEILEKELEDNLNEVDEIIFGIKKPIKSYVEWAKENRVKNIFVMYIFSFVPILNILIFFKNIESICKLMKIKINIFLKKE